MSVIAAKTISAVPIIGEPIIGQPVGATNEKTFLFNGTDNYADFVTPWEPDGIPYRVEFTTDGEVAAIASILGSSAGNNPKIGTFFSAPLVGYVDEGGAARSLIADTGLSGSGAKRWAIDYTATGVTVTVGEITKTSAFVPKSKGVEFDRIGANFELNRFIDNAVKDLRLTDLSPLHGREFQVGDGAIIGQINEPIPLSGDLHISFEWVRENRQLDGLSWHVLLGQDSAATCDVRVFDSLRVDGNENALKINCGGGSAQWNDFLEGVALGQHITVEMWRTSGTWTASLDGVTPIAASSSSAMSDDYLDVIGVRNGNNHFVGALANVEIETNVPAPTSGSHGFLDYGSDHPDVMDFCAGTSSGAMGSLSVVGTAPTYDGAKGFKLQAGTAVSYNATFTSDNLNLKDDGFTLQFEVESAFFAESYAPSSDFEALVHVRNQSSIWETIGRSLATENFVRATFANPAAQQPGGFKTMDDGCGDTILVHLSVDTSTKKATLYTDYAPRSTFDIGDLSLSNLDINLGGPSGLFGISNHAFYMRNVQISRYPVSLTGQAVKTVSVYGDSIVALASYDNGYIDHPPTIDDPDNNPQNTGYVSPDYVLGQGQAASTNWYKNRSLLDIMHKGLALKGIYPTAQHINGFGRSGSRLVDWDSRGDNLFDDRIDAALGIGTEYPTTTLPDDVSDIAFISEGTNDAVYFMLHGGTPSDFEDQLITAAKAGMDRLIDEAGVKHIVYFSPIRVFIFTYPLESYPEITERAYNAIMRLDGYRGVCRVVDVYTGWTTSYTTDALHPNPTGMEYMIAQAADAIPNFLLSGAQTFTYPLERHPDDDLVILNTDPSSGAAFNGYWSAANWVNKPANDRCYRMREGSGDEFYDSYDRSESQVNRAEIQGTTPEEQWS